MNFESMFIFVVVLCEVSLYGVSIELICSQLPSLSMDFHIIFNFMVCFAKILNNKTTIIHNLTHSENIQVI